MAHLLRRHLPWVATLSIGLCLLAAGLFFIVKGLDTKAMIRDELATENVMTSADAEQFGVAGGLLVTDAKTALAQSKTIDMHSTSIKGEVLVSGVPTKLHYAEMKKELFVTPKAYSAARATYVTGLTLRGALNMAVMGFGIADMAVGAGLIITIAGVATLLLATPSLYMLAGIVVKRSD